MAGGSPCGACKFLRRKCAPDCVFAPYFSSEQGPTRFAAIHKVFGASNVAKLLTQLPVHHRCEAVLTIAYEAQARVRDPVYGCVSHIFALQQQVAYLQAQLMQVKAQLGSNGVVMNNSTTPTSNQHLDNNNQQWRLQLPTDSNNQNYHSFVGSEHPSGNYCHPISPQSQSSLESCIDQVGDPNFANKVENCNYSAQDYHFYMQHYYHPSQKKRYQEDDDGMGELQELAIRMMRT